MRKLAFLLLLGICAYQQMEIRDLIHGLQHDAFLLNDAVMDVPSPPNIPREEALERLMHPREQ